MIGILINKNSMNKEERYKEFEKELEALQTKLWVSLYAANVVLKSGEVVPLIKLHNDLEENEEEKNEVSK